MTDNATIKPVGPLALAALGIVFGDIGTSPLYTLPTVFGASVTPVDALGLLSLVLWSLLMVVASKYVALVMRADNDGEGGILALMSLLRRHQHHRPLIIGCGLFGAALIYSDGAITPAISVLSAIEGLKLASPQIGPYILPLSVGILLALFAAQSRGTAKIGQIFGPVMVVWFLVIAVLGLRGIFMHPAALAAFNPLCGLKFIMLHKARAFFVMGSIFLAVTGAEALYADMGHIGARPIRLAWYGLVLPALLLNYTGQVGFYLAAPGEAQNVFFQLCPPGFLLPLIGLATLATIIASQAIITGAFSMTRQAIQLGWCPRLEIIQTSAEGYGQIYIAAVNWLLMLTTVGVAVLFGDSAHLAAAYGVAVSLTMLLTTLLLYVAMREIWRWSRLASLLTAGMFLLIDAVFFASNLVKFIDGGWLPLALALGIYTCMITWRRGSVAMAHGMRLLTIPVDDFIRRLALMPVARVPGTAVFLSKATAKIPQLVIWHVEHSRALHRHVIALSILIAQAPLVAEHQRLTVEKMAGGFWRLIGQYGFMEKPDIPTLLQLAKSQVPELDISDVVYYVGHESARHLTDGHGMPLWQEKLFALLQRNSAQLDDYLNLPREQVVEIGRQIAI